MAVSRLRLVFDSTPHDALTQVASGPALLSALDGDGDLVRLYQPPPTLAFSGKDCAGTGIAAAAEAARAHGFVPVRRGPGGRAAAYHRGSLVIDHVGTDAYAEPISARFARFGAFYRGVLRGLGVPAEVGEVPGEFCPGEYSVNDGAGHKVVGTAQRITKAGWLFSAIVLVRDPEPLREVLIDVYAALRLDWDPSTVGTLDGSAPGLTVAAVGEAVIAGYRRDFDVSVIDPPVSAPDPERFRAPGAG